MASPVPQDETQVIILGAGRGTRLGDRNAGLPKTLLRVDGRTLLERQLDLVAEVFPRSAVSLVVGHRADIVRAAVGSSVVCIENENYTTTNTAASLQLALVASPTNSVILNGDVFFDQAALEVAASLTNGAVCEFKSEVDPEEIQIKVDADLRIEAIGKNLGGVGEAVGIYRISGEFARAFLKIYLRGDRVRYYEDVFTRVLRYVPFYAASLDGATAIEIDTPADLDRVENLHARV